MALKLITPAAAWSASFLADVKQHCKVETTDEDTLISAYIAAAADMAEQATGRALLPQTWKLTLDSMPDAEFELTRVPVQSVTSVVYADINGTDQTWSASNYVLQNSDDFAPAAIVPAFGKSWPSYRAQPDTIRVTFVAGYTNEAAVPEPIKQWIKLMVAAMYANREAVDENQSYSLGFADRLLDRYKIWKL